MYTLIATLVLCVGGILIGHGLLLTTKNTSIVPEIIILPDKLLPKHKDNAENNKNNI